MLNERILTVLSWIAVLSMFAYIGWGLGRQFEPSPLTILHSTYTNEYVERLEQTKIKYQQQASWYEDGYNGITKILGAEK